MKLELKHLAPYLPYGLKMKLLNFPFDGHIRILELDCGHDFHFYLQNNYVRPFLRPLSDLTKEIEVNGERFVPIIKLNSDCLPDFGSTSRPSVKACTKSLVRPKVVAASNNPLRWDVCECTPPSDNNPKK